MNNKKVTKDEKTLRSALKVWRKECAPEYNDNNLLIILRKMFFVKEKLLPLLKECYPSIKNATYFKCDKTQYVFNNIIHLIKSDEYVLIWYEDYQVYINVTADSFSVMTIDILKHLG